jgi:hypothetical protein
MVRCPSGSFCCEDAAHQNDAIAGTCCIGSAAGLFQAVEGTTMTVIGATGFGDMQSPTFAPNSNPATSPSSVPGAGTETKPVSSPVAVTGTVSGGNGGGGKDRDVALGAGIGGGIFGAAVVLGLVFWVVMRKRTRPGGTQGFGPNGPGRAEKRTPAIGALGVGDIGARNELDARPTHFYREAQELQG